MVKSSISKKVGVIKRGNSVSHIVSLPLIWMDIAAKIEGHIEEEEDHKQQVDRMSFFYLLNELNPMNFDNYSLII